jgi:hypothetical protein
MHTPTLHKPVPIGSKVRVEDTSITGEVVGISSMHVIFQYIILLDNPIEDEYGIHKAIVYPGSLLEALDGSNWKIDFNKAKPNTEQKIALFMQSDRG